VPPYYTEEERNNFAGVKEHSNESSDNKENILYTNSKNAQNNNNNNMYQQNENVRINLNNQLNMENSNSNLSNNGMNNLLSNDLSSEKLLPLSSKFEYEKI